MTITLYVNDNYFNNYDVLLWNACTLYLIWCLKLVMCIFWYASCHVTQILLRSLFYGYKHLMRALFQKVLNCFSILRIPTEHFSLHLCNTCSNSLSFWAVQNSSVQTQWPGDLIKTYRRNEQNYNKHINNYNEQC